MASALNFWEEKNVLFSLSSFEHHKKMKPLPLSVLFSLLQPARWKPSSPIEEGDQFNRREKLLETSSTRKVAKPDTTFDRNFVNVRNIRVLAPLGWREEGLFWRGKSTSEARFQQIFYPSFPICNIGFGYRIGASQWWDDIGWDYFCTKRDASRSIQEFKRRWKENY